MGVKVRRHSVILVRFRDPPEPLHCLFLVLTSFPGGRDVSLLFRISAYSHSLLSSWIKYPIGLPPFNLECLLLSVKVEGLCSKTSIKKQTFLNGDGVDGGGVEGRWGKEMGEEEGGEAVVGIKWRKKKLSTKKQTNKISNI